MTPSALQDILRTTAEDPYALGDTYAELKKKYARTLQLMIDLREESNNDIHVLRGALFRTLNKRRVAQAKQIEKMMNDREAAKRKS